MTQSILITLKEETDARSQALLQQVNRELTLWFESYSDTTVQLSASQELLRYKMLQNEINAQKGIDLLSDVKSYDADVYDIFMYYGNDKIYSSIGMSKHLVYLGNTLDCTQESVSYAADILSNSEKGVHLLEQNSESGYLMYHYPVRLNTDGASVSVNVLMQVSVLKNTLEQLLKNCDTYITVSFGDRKQLVFFGDAQKSSLAYIGNEMVKGLNGADYTLHSVHSDEMETEINVYYEADTIYRDINQKQILSYGIMAVLLLVAVIVSYIISRRYHTPIHQLATQVASQREHGQELDEGDKRKTDELEYLKRTFGIMMDESNRMSRGLKEYKVLLRPLTALLLFHGMVKEAPFIDRMLELCDYEFHEDYYVLLGIAVLQSKRGKRTGDVYTALQNYFEDDLYCNVTVGDKKVLTVLVDIPNPDYLCKVRIKVEENIRSLCKENGGDKVFVSFSQVYKDSSMISHAYIEAISGMEYLSSEDMYGEKTAFYEKISHTDSPIKQLDEENLDRWEAALREQDQDAASDCLNTLLYSIEYSSNSKEMRRYLRYCILQRIIQVIKEDEDERIDSALLSRAIHINPTAEGSFGDDVHNLVKLICFTEEKEDAIKKAIEYIEENYSRYDLSLDEVAGCAGLTKTYLSKLFKVKTGDKYIDYLSKLRLEEAKRLLRETDLSIKEIVEEVGYYDVPRFRKKFKAVYGINAYQYRKSL